VAFLLAVYILAKILHWISSDRVDFMDQTPNHSLKTLLPLFLIIVSLVGFDVYQAYASSVDFMKNGPSLSILFGFEYSVLFVNAAYLLTKFSLNCVDYHITRETNVVWENKSVYLLYVELVVEFFKLVLYTMFFIAVFLNYGLPLNMMRDLYMTVKAFYRKVRDAWQFRTVTANMEQRYPDATDEELANSDRICIICREEMTVAKRLPCGHMFHLPCLRSWLERQQSCPTCRRDVLAPPTPQSKKNMYQLMM
jgi:E3 ubiquitin-protein ligase synoviolin